MKFIFSLFCIFLFLTNCKTSKNYLLYSGNDNTVFDAIKALKKNQYDTAAIRALPILYNQAQERNLRKINSYNSSKEPGRWDKIVEAYNTLQQMHNAIIDID